MDIEDIISNVKYSYLVKGIMRHSLFIGISLAIFFDVAIDMAFNYVQSFWMAILLLIMSLFSATYNISKLSIFFDMYLIKQKYNGCKDEN